ncbi:hypothetical protein ACYCFK_17770 [Stutzerimonas stutzeri]
MEELWIKMAGLYGHKWASSFGADVDPDGIWAIALAGLQSNQISHGLASVVRMGNEWPPSAPEFRKLCLAAGKVTPESVGLPPLEAAYGQAIRGDRPSHPAIRQAIIETGVFDIRQAKSKDTYLRKRFEHCYLVIAQRIAMGRPIDGKIADAIGYDGDKSVVELADEESEQQLQARIVQQGIPADAASARQLLLAKLRIKRGGDRHA